MSVTSICETGVAVAVAVGADELERDLEALRAVAVGAHDDDEPGRRERDGLRSLRRDDDGHGLSVRPGPAVGRLKGDLRVETGGTGRRGRREGEGGERGHGEREDDAPHEDTSWVRVLPSLQRLSGAGSRGPRGPQLVAAVGPRVLVEEQRPAGRGEALDVAHGPGAARRPDRRPARHLEGLAPPRGALVLDGKSARP